MNLLFIGRILGILAVVFGTGAGAAADTNFRLAADSPCINAGTNAAWMDTAIDLGGRPRIRYGRVDIGCYEYYLNVKVNGIPIDRIKRINGVDKNRIFRINQ